MDSNEIVRKTTSSEENNKANPEDEIQTLLKRIKPPRELIKKCERQSINTEEEIACLKKTVEAYKEVRLHYFTLHMRIRKEPEHYRELDNVGYKEIEAIANDFEKMEQLTIAYIEDTEKALEDKIRYLKANNQDKEQGGEAEKPEKQIELPTGKQHRWMGDLKDLQELLTQLSLTDNGFIDQKSADNATGIYNNHFKDDEKVCSTDPETKINWISDWNSYKIFFGLFSDGKLFFEGRKENRVFFANHFLFNKKPKTRKQVKNVHFAEPEKKDIENLSSIHKHMVKKLQ